MNKLVPFIIVAVLPTSAAFGSDDNLSRIKMFSGAADEFEADIPLHRTNWKMAMDRTLEYVKNGDFAEALKMAAVARNEAVQTGANDASLAETEKLTADIYAAQNNTTFAERSYRRSVYLFERANSPDKGEFAAALNSYALFLKRANRVREASKFEMRANLLQGDENTHAAANRAL